MEEGQQEKQGIVWNVLKSKTNRRDMKGPNSETLRRTMINDPCYIAWCMMMCMLRTYSVNVLLKNYAY